MEFIAIFVLSCINGFLGTMLFILKGWQISEVVGITTIIITVFGLIGRLLYNLFRVTIKHEANIQEIYGDLIEFKTTIDKSKESLSEINQHSMSVQNCLRQHQNIDKTFEEVNKKLDILITKLIPSNHEKNH